MQSAKGLEHWAWSQGCGLKNVFSLAKRNTEQDSYTWTNIQAGNEMKWRSGNERQLSSFHHANRGKVSEHYIGAIKIS